MKNLLNKIFNRKKSTITNRTIGYVNYKDGQILELLGTNEEKDAFNQLLAEYDINCSLKVDEYYKLLKEDIKALLDIIKKRHNVGI